MVWFIFDIYCAVNNWWRRELVALLAVYLCVSAFVVSHLIILPLITEENCGAFPGGLFICFHTRGVFPKFYAYKFI